MKETDIQKSILLYLDAHDITAWRNNSGSVRVKGGYMHLSPTGTPDIVGYLPDGRFLGIEVKRPGEDRTPAQVAFAINAEACGALCFVARSVEDVEKLLLPLTNSGVRV